MYVAAAVAAIGLSREAAIARRCHFARFLAQLGRRAGVEAGWPRTTSSSALSLADKSACKDVAALLAGSRFARKRRFRGRAKLRAWSAAARRGSDSSERPQGANLCTADERRSVRSQRWSQALESFHRDSDSIDPVASLETSNNFGTARKQPYQQRAHRRTEVRLTMLLRLSCFASSTIVHHRLNRERCSPRRVDQAMRSSTSN